MNSLENLTDEEIKGKLLWHRSWGDYMAKALIREKASISLLESEKTRRDNLRCNKIPGTVWEAKDGTIGLKGATPRQWWLLLDACGKQFHEVAYTTYIDRLEASTTCHGDLFTWVKKTL